MPAAVTSRRPPRPQRIALQREHLLEWLTRRADVPVRVLHAPTGFGKSLLMQSYVARRRDAAYIHASEIASCDRLLHRLAMELGFTALADGVASFSDAIASLETPFEIALDDIDTLPTDALEALLELMLRTPPALTFILGTRSRAAIEPRCFLDGTAQALDPMRLAFDASEIAMLCSAYSVAATEYDIVELQRETDGWPMLVHAAIRHAHLSQRSLENCFRLWFEEYGGALHEMIDDATGTLLQAATPNARVSELQALERSGEFVCRKDGRYAVLQPVITLLRRDLGDAQTNAILPIEVNVLGEFEAHIGGTKVNWIRRKDAQVFKYLALTPSGTVTRKELCRVFWPQHDAPQAHQNLRTSCCNIRSALRACLPATPVERYFLSSGTDVSVPHSAIVTDLEKFLNHCAASEAAMREAQYDIALAEDETAVTLYRGPLVIEPEDAFYANLTREAEQSFEAAQRRITTLRQLHPSAVCAPQIA